MGGRGSSGNSSAPAKKFECLFLATTVYDRKVPEVRWFENQREYKIFSNIDFNYLAGVSWFETEDTQYMLLMGLGNETSEQVEAFNQYAREQGWPKFFLKELPPTGTFSLTRSEYAVVEDERHPAAAEGELNALDALHVYFDSNKQRLIEEYEKREVANAERARWLKEHRPVPKDTIINFRAVQQTASMVLPMFAGKLIPSPAAPLIRTGIATELTTAETGATFGQATSTNYRATFFTANPSLEGQVVVHHAVEQQALRIYPTQVTAAEIHSLENLRGIPNSINAELLESDSHRMEPVL